MLAVFPVSNDLNFLMIFRCIARHAELEESHKEKRVQKEGQEENERTCPQHKAVRSSFGQQLGSNRKRRSAREKAGQKTHIHGLDTRLSMLSGTAA